MARRDQLVTFPEVFLEDYGNAPRSYYPTAIGRPLDIESGGDPYGWSAQAVKSAMDGVRQTAKAKKVYERGMRPFERLNLTRSSVGIRPFGIGTTGGQFSQRPALKGGIMFTKAGQDYLQKLLNERQKQYAEMAGDRVFREVPTSNTDEAIGDSALSIVYPLLDIVLDDLKSQNVKSLTTFNNWWSQMLVTLPILGANYRERIRTEIINPLNNIFSQLEDGFTRGSTRISPEIFKSLGTRINKALNVLTQYIGEETQGQVDNKAWSDEAVYDAMAKDEVPLNANGVPMSFDEWRLKVESDRQRRGVEQTDIGKAPIDAPANVREKLVRELNNKIGVKASASDIKKARRRVSISLRDIRREQRGDPDFTGLEEVDIDNVLPYDYTPLPTEDLPSSRRVDPSSTDYTFGPPASNNVVVGDYASTNAY